MLPGMFLFLGVFLAVIGIIVGSVSDDGGFGTGLMAFGIFIIIASLFLLVMFAALRDKEKKSDNN